MTIMNSPEALFAGVVVGFAAAKLSGRRKGGMGGGMIS